MTSKSSGKQRVDLLMWANWWIFRRFFFLSLLDIYVVCARTSIWIYVNTETTHAHSTREAIARVLKNLGRAWRNSPVISSRVGCYARARQIRRRIAHTHTARHVDLHGKIFAQNAWLQKFPFTRSWVVWVWCPCAELMTTRVRAYTLHARLFWFYLRAHFARTWNDMRYVHSTHPTQTFNWVIRARLFIVCVFFFVMSC